MKKNVLKVCSLLLCCCSTAAQAQDLKSVLSGVLSKVTSSVDSTSTLTNVLGSLIGTTKVEPAQLAGTWQYSQPAVAFESEDVLNKIGGTAVATTVEKKVAAQLTKLGISSGAMTLTFATDSTFTCKIKTKTVTGKYTVKDATIQFTFVTGKTISANVKLTGTVLQVSFKADKLLTFVQTVSSLAKTSNQTLTAITSMVNSYKGMQLGLKFNKQ